MKNFKILALNEKNCPAEIFVLVLKIHSEDLKVLNQKLREELQNN